MNTTILQVTFYDGTRETVEYQGDDLVGITKKLNTFKRKIAAVEMRAIDPKGKILFDKTFSYVPAENLG